MGGQYQVQLHVTQQEDGQWRVEVPDLPGCWVDAPTVAQAITEIQAGVAMALDEYEERGWDLPSTVERLNEGPWTATLPVIVQEHSFTRGGGMFPCLSLPLGQPMVPLGG